jgi:hypothetical protein
VSKALAAERARLRSSARRWAKPPKDFRDEIEKQIDSKVGELKTELNVMRAAMTSWNYKVAELWRTYDWAARRGSTHCAGPDRHAPSPRPLIPP